MISVYETSEGMGSLSLDVLMVCEGTIKDETQVLPYGAWVKGGSP
jgi:hypothetical protein